MNIDYAEENPLRYMGLYPVKPITLTQKIQEIYYMLSVGYVSIVAGARRSLIQFDKMVIGLGGSRDITADIMQDIYKSYWVPFCQLMDIHFTAISVCPYQLIRHNFKIGEKSTFTKIPVALEPNTFIIQPALNKNGEKKYNITILNKRKDDQPEIFYIQSPYRQGPLQKDCIVDSECGSLIDHWLWLKDQWKKHDIAVDNALNPKIWIQHQAKTFNATAMAETARYEDINKDENESGYLVEKEPTLLTESVNNTIIIPDGFMISPHQPHLADPSVLKIEEKTQKFNEYVDAGFRMHFQTINADTGGLHSRSQSATDEAKSSTGAKMAERVSELIYGVELVHAQIYPDYKSKIVVDIPVKSLVDNEMIVAMLDRNFISHDVACEEVSKISSIHESRFNKNNDAPKGKRAKMDTAPKRE